MSRFASMNSVQTAIAALEDLGWTLKAISDYTGIPWGTLRHWKVGRSRPRDATEAMSHLQALLKIKRIPKQRRYSTPRVYNGDRTDP